MKNQQKRALQGAFVGGVAGLIVAGFANKPLTKYIGVGAVIGAVAYYFMSGRESANAANGVTATVTNVEQGVSKTSQK